MKWELRRFIIFKDGLLIYFEELSNLFWRLKYWIIDGMY
jgi:hypothetical protein